MNKLTLTVAAIALTSLPVSAFAGMGKDRHNATYKHNTTYNQQTQKYRSANDATSEQRLAMQKSSADKGHDMERSYATSPGDDNEQTYTSGRYQLANGLTLQVDKAKAKFVRPNGSAYFAPSGEYLTRDGQKFFIQDGLVTGYLMSGYEQQVYIDADVDNDGTYFENNENNVRVRN